MMFESKFCYLISLLLTLFCFHSSSCSRPPSLSTLSQDSSMICNGSNTVIPFPFGIMGLNTNPRAPVFNITCKQDIVDLRTSYPVLVLNNSSNSNFHNEIRLHEISLSEGFIRVEIEQKYWDTNLRGNRSMMMEFLNDPPFTFSASRNVLTVIGCDAMVTLRPQGNNTNVTRSCVSFCDSPESVVDGFCSGVGCCQASIPEKMNSYELEVKSIRDMMRSSPVESSSYGTRTFIMEQMDFKFSVEYLFGMEDIRYSPKFAVFDWSIGNKSCEEAKRIGGEHYICGEKALCTNSSNGNGYLCLCKSGYDGNPYLQDGCIDINECTLNETSPCLGKCTNSDGGYSCHCPFGKTGDGKIEGSGCKRLAPLDIALAAGLCLLIFFIVGGLLFFRKLLKRMNP